MGVEIRRIGFWLVVAVVLCFPNRVWSKKTKTPTVSSHHAIETRAAQLLKDASKRFNANLEDASLSLHKAIVQSKRRFRKRILRNVFSQRVGWMRFRHSLRDNAGLVLGCCMVFRGNTSPFWVEGGAVAVQSAQLGWDVFDAFHVLPHEPWLYDASAVAVAMAVWKQLPGTPLFKCLPSVFLATDLFQCVSLVIDQWNEDTKVHSPRMAYAILVTALSFLGLRLANIPIPLAADSLSGAFLVYDSVLAEVAGNWVYMTEALMTLAYRVFPILKRLFSKIASLVWNRGKVLERLYLWKEHVDMYRTRIQLAVEPLERPRKKVVFYIQNHPVTRWVQQISKRLQKAFRRIIWPFGIATWGIVVQMKYKANALQVLQFTIDPIRFVQKRVETYFSAEHVRRAFLHLLRHVTKRMRPDR